MTARSRMWFYVPMSVSKKTVVDNDWDQRLNYRLQSQPCRTMVATIMQQSEGSYIR